MKDHEIARLVNDLRDIAVTYRDADQLRERIAAVLVPMLRGERSPDSLHERKGRLILLNYEVIMLRVIVSDLRDERARLLGYAGAADMDAELAKLQRNSGTVTASPEGPSQALESGAAGPIRTGDLLITNQPTGSAIYPNNQVLSELGASPRPVEDVAQDSITYADVTASPGASSEGAQ